MYLNKYFNNRLFWHFFTETFAYSYDAYLREKITSRIERRMKTNQRKRHREQTQFGQKTLM